MFPRRQHISQKKGFTLTEVAIVLGIVGLILGSIWVAAAAVYKNMRVSTTSNQILQIAQSIRAMHATSLVIDTNVTTKALAQAGAIPKDMLDNATDPTVARDVWGYNITINASQSAGTNGDSFTIQLPGIPRDACVDLLVRNTGAGRDSGLVKAGTTTTAIDNNSMPITVTSAVSACSSTTNNTVEFVFMLKS